MKQKVYVFESKYGDILIESNSSSGRITRGDKKDEQVSKSVGKFEDAIKTVTNLGKLIKDTLKEIAPDEASVEIGVKFDAKANAFLVSSSSEVEFKFTVKWGKGIE